MFLFYRRDWRCCFFRSGGLLDRRCWLFTRSAGCNFPAWLRLFLFQLGRWCRLAGLYMVREICRSRFLRPRKGGAREDNATAYNGENSSVNVHWKISSPHRRRQPARLLTSWLELCADKGRLIFRRLSLTVFASLF